MAKLIKALFIFSVLLLAAEKVVSEGKAAAVKMVNASFAETALTQGTFYEVEDRRLACPRKDRRGRLSSTSATLRRCDTPRSSSSLLSS